jgi:hypothetical protein
MQGPARSVTGALAAVDVKGPDQRGADPCDAPVMTATFRSLLMASFPCWLQLCDRPLSTAGPNWTAARSTIAASTIKAMDLVCMVIVASRCLWEESGDDWPVLAQPHAAKIALATASRLRPG